MRTVCYGYASSDRGLLKVMDVMLRNGIAIIGTTDSGRESPLAPDRFHAFGIAEDSSQVVAAMRENNSIWMEG